MNTREDMRSNERFSFGKNWASYVDSALDETRIQTATQALKDFLRMDSLHGQTFLDIGSGSGLPSLAAYRLGAERIISFDYDIDAVRTTETLRSRVGAPDNWQVFQGSILDPTLAAKYRASIVYSWGVLHHTGQMWQAIRNAAQIVQPGGLLCIAIYQTEKTTPRWQKIKYNYVHASPLVQHLMVYGYEAYTLVIHALHGRMPWQVIDSFKARGMNWHHDMIDWVGGYPFETATAEELCALCENEIGMTLINHIRPTAQGGLNQMIFRAKA
jgi:SAM-dependent methyltransferase